MIRDSARAVLGSPASAKGIPAPFLSCRASSLWPLPDAIRRIRVFCIARSDLWSPISCGMHPFRRVHQHLLAGFCRARMTIEKRIRLGPRVQPAIRAREFGPRLCFSGLRVSSEPALSAGTRPCTRWRSQFPDQAIFPEEGPTYIMKKTVFQNEMRHVVARHCTARFTSCARHKADTEHHRCPFTIVIAPAAGVTEFLLPDMRHFMRERGQDFLIRPPCETVWI